MASGAISKTDCHRMEVRGGSERERSHTCTNHTITSRHAMPRHNSPHIVFNDVTPSRHPTPTTPTSGVDLEPGGPSAAGPVLLSTRRLEIAHASRHPCDTPQYGAPHTLGWHPELHPAPQVKTQIKSHAPPSLVHLERQDCTAANPRSPCIHVPTLSTRSPTSKLSLKSPTLSPPTPRDPFGTPDGWRARTHGDGRPEGVGRAPGGRRWAWV